MADDVLRVGSDFDPSGLTRGLDIGAASLEQFQAMVKRVEKSLPGLDTQSLFKIAAVGAKQAAEEVKHLNTAMQGLGAGGGGPAPRIIRDKVAELKLLAGQLQQIPALEDAVGAGAKRMAAGFAVAGAAARAATGGSESWERGMANLTKQQTAFVGSSKDAHRATNLMRTGLVTLAAQSVGTTSALGNLAQSALFLAGGATSVIAGAAGILAAVVLYEELTKVTRQAREERDKLFQAGQERVGAPAQSGIFAEHAGATQRLLDLGKARVKLEEDLERKIGLTTGGLEKEIALQHVLQEQAKARAIVQQLEAQMSADTIQAQRDAALQLLQDTLSLQRALQSIVEQSAQARHNLAMQGPQTFGGQPGTLSEEEVRFTKERIALAQQATAIEVSGLEQQLRLVQKQHVFTDAEKVARNAEIVHLTQAIALRRLEGDRQVESIRNEQALLDLTRQRILDEQAHLKRVEAAGVGGGNRFGPNPMLVPDITLPTSDDVGRLRVELEKIPPIGLPTAADWEAARKAALPSILQGARQQGLTPGAGQAQAIQDARESATQLRVAMDQVEESTLAAAVAVLGLGDALGRTLESGLQLGNALGALKQANLDIGAATNAAEKLAGALAKISAIGGIIGAGFSLFSGISDLFNSFNVGGGPTAHEQLLRENNERLAQLKASLDNSLLGAGALSTAGAQLASLGAIPHRFGPKGTDLGPDQAAFERQLAAAGLTIEEWAAQVERITGWQVLDSEGRIIADRFKAAADAIEVMRQAALHFGTSISDRAEVMATRDKLFGGGSDLERNRELLLGGLDLGDAWEEQIRQLDLSTGPGRAAYQDFLKTLFAMAEAGQLTAEQLAAFPDVQSLLDPLSQGADDLAAANANAAAEAQALADAAAEAARQFRDALPTLYDLQNQLLGNTDAASQFQTALDVLRLTAPDVAQMFQGLDFNDPAAREEMRQRMLALIDQIMAGHGELAGPGPHMPGELDALLAFLQQAADLLGTFDSAVQDATKSLLNVPQGLNLAALEFQAQTAGGGLARHIPFEPLNDRALGGLGSRRGTDGASLPQMIDQRVTGNITIIVQGATQSPAEIAEVVKRVLQRKSLARTGSPDNWGD